MLYVKFHFFNPRLGIHECYMLLRAKIPPSQITISPTAAKVLQPHLFSYKDINIHSAGPNEPIFLELLMPESIYFALFSNFSNFIDVAKIFPGIL